MLELTSAGRPVQLLPGTSTQIERHSPLFDEESIAGSFSYSFTVPARPNGPLYGFPERPDSLSPPGAQLPAELGEAGIPLLTGAQTIKSANPSKYSISLQGGLSGAGLSGRQLSSFAYGGLRAVPRWVPAGDVLLPGLVRHANEVVASPAAYDYVFAPLRNEYLAEGSLVAGLPPDPLAYPPATVNRWNVAPVALFGMPAGGSFGYGTDYRVPGAVVIGEAFQLLPPYCPWPRLRYVLQAICAESGLAVDPAELLPGELGELVLVSNALLVDRGDNETLRFSLADVVPALTVAELLAGLRQALGIVLYQDVATGRVRTGYLVERVAASAAYADLTDALAGYAEATVAAAPAGLTLTYQVDGDDALTKDWLTTPLDPARVLEPVATLADLPTVATILSDNPQAGQLRLVQQQNQYYVCSLRYLDEQRVSLAWLPLSGHLPPVLLDGGGEEQAQGICFTQQAFTRLGLTADRRRALLLPAISQPPYQAGQTTVARSAALRLLFYRGLQLADDGESRAPQLSPTSPSGAYSLRLEGSTGTYAQWLQAWLPVKRSPVSYKVPLLLSPLTLAQLDDTWPVQLDGVRYLVRQLTATIPLRKPASLELVRL